MEQLFLFNNIKEKQVLNEVLKALKKEPNNAIGELLNFGLSNGFVGNLWHNYIAYILAFNENSFSINAENNGCINGDIALIMHDVKIYMDLMKLDISLFTNEYEKNISNFTLKRENYKHYNLHLVNIISNFKDELIKQNNELDFYSTILNFYKTNGVGDLGFHKAFRISNEGNLIPIKDVLEVSFDDLVGYEYQKEQIIYNTDSFINYKPANNVLLYGDSGTGKSTSIKAILNKYYANGLRMIEVYKNQMSNVAALLASLRERNYFFIIYMDDLSFEESEVEYKHLKSIIEGGLEAKPKNVLVYATSNRRHLVKESVKDNGSINDDLHRNETSAEKLSLASRFGLSILFMSPDNKEFKNIIKTLAIRHNIKLPESELMKKAQEWEMTKGALSGRSAEQFIMYIAGNNAKK